MGKYQKVVILNNEIEASIMKDILNERQIPHVFVSYHSLAYDGIFQIGGWGHIEARPEDHQEIITIYQEILEDFEQEED